jgi:DNA-binding CsgD family transcriptional regulator
MPANPTPERLDRLTPMETACLRLVARRLSSKQIAAELGIAKTSVDTYCNRARSKLGVGDRYEAARLVVAHAGPPPVAAAPPPEPAPPRPSPSPVVPTPWTPRVRLALAALTVLLAVLAVGSLVSGLSALEELRQ